MSVFRIVSSVTIVPALSKQVHKDAISGVVFRFQLLLFNNLFIPCIATAFTSPNCFQELLVEPAPVSTTYQFEDCSMFVLAPEDVLCIDYSSYYRDTASFHPAFVYNYQCTSELLNAYIPVLIIAFALQLLLPLVFAAVLLPRVDVSLIPSCLHQALHGIFWPKHWTQFQPSATTTGGNSPPTRLSLVRITEIVCCDMLHPVSVLLTFGLCSPALAFSVALFVMVKMQFWRWAIYRYCTICVQNAPNDSMTVTNCLEVLLLSLSMPFKEVMKRAFRWVLLYSAGFMLLITVDVTGSVSDHWAGPVAMAVIAAVLWMLSSSYSRMERLLQHKSSQNAGSVKSAAEDISNPLNSEVFEIGGNTF